MDEMKKQEAEQAVPPAQFVTKVVADAENIRKEAISEIEEKIKRKKQLYGELCESEAWEALRGDIRQMAGAVTKGLTPAKGSGFDLQEIGMKYIIAAQIAAALEDIINLVEINKKESEIPQEEV